MEPKDSLVRLIELYLSAAADLHSEIRAHLGADDILSFAQDYPERREGQLEHGGDYQIHGIGFGGVTASGFDVEVDFGPARRVDCFDEYRLKRFVEENRSKLPPDLSSLPLVDCFQSAVESDVLRAVTENPKGLHELTK